MQKISFFISHINIYLFKYKLMQTGNSAVCNAHTLQTGNSAVRNAHTLQTENSAVRSAHKMQACSQ